VIGCESDTPLFRPICRTPRPTTFVMPLKTDSPFRSAVAAAFILMSTSTTPLCPYALGFKASPEIPRVPDGLLERFDNADTRKLLSRLLVEVPKFWMRSPDWLTMGEYLARLDRPVTVWLAVCSCGRDEWSAALACEAAGVQDYRVVAWDIDGRFIDGASGDRKGRFRTAEIFADVPAWVRRYFEVSHKAQLGPKGHVVQDDRGHTKVYGTDGTAYPPEVRIRKADMPPRCDVAIVADVWRPPTARTVRHQRETEAQYRHRPLSWWAGSLLPPAPNAADQQALPRGIPRPAPLLSLDTQRELAACIHAQLADDGLLMTGAQDVIDMEGMNIAALQAGTVSAAAHYRPSDALTELFEPATTGWPAVSADLEKAMIRHRVAPRPTNVTLTQPSTRVQS
jgi:hypothetical protein